MQVKSELIYRNTIIRNISIFSSFKLTECGYLSSTDPVFTASNISLFFIWRVFELYFKFFLLRKKHYALITILYPPNKKCGEYMPHFSVCFFFLRIVILTTSYFPSGDTHGKLHFICREEQMLNTQFVCGILFTNLQNLFYPLQL